MALDSYTNLKTEIGEWLNRQDLTSKIPTFIRLLEAQINRELRVNDMIVEDEIVIGTNGRFEIPTDSVGLYDLYLTNATYTPPLESATISIVRQMLRDQGDTTGVPVIYTVIGTTGQVAPLPDGVYSINVAYYQSIPALGDSTATNWLLDKHPDIYLFGSLLQAAPYLKDDDRVEMWSTALGTLLDTIRVQDERSRSGTSPMKMRVRNPY